MDSAADRLLAALRTDQPDSLMVLLSGDAVLMPPNEAELKGKAAVRTWYEQFLAQMRTSTLAISNRETVISEEWAAEVASFEWALSPVAGGPPVVERGNYMQLWQRAPDGRWLLSRELWNSSAQ